MRADRLQQLAAHLRAGRHGGHQRFDLMIVRQPFTYVEKQQPMARQHCGTAGCAMGELPVVFPQDWEFPAGLDTVCLRTASCADLYDEVAVFFGIYRTDAFNLFNACMPRWWAAGQLEEDATAEQVADSIDAFVSARHQRELARREDNGEG